MPTDKTADALFDSRKVRELADILNETGLTEIEVEREGLKIRVAKSTGPVSTVYAQPAAPTQVAAVAIPAPEATKAETSGEIVASPMVGTIYLQPQPGAPPFTKAGDTVVAGQTLLLVEAMKTMNPITAPRAGTILEILVSDAQPVEFGEPLAVIG